MWVGILSQICWLELPAVQVDLVQVMDWVEAIVVQEHLLVDFTIFNVVVFIVTPGWNEFLIVLFGQITARVGSDHLFPLVSVKVGQIVHACCRC